MGTIIGFIITGVFVRNKIKRHIANAGNYDYFEENSRTFFKASVSAPTSNIDHQRDGDSRR